MERIDIKDFIPSNKMKILNGVFNKVKKNLEGKELEFYYLDKKVISKIVEEKNVDINDTPTLLYTFIPILSNVEMSLALDEFKKLYDVPSLQFIYYINAFIEHFKELITTALTINSIADKTISFVKEMGIEIPVEEVRVIKTKEEIENEIDILYGKLSTDKENRKAIQEQINALEKELEELETENNE